MRTGGLASKVSMQTCIFCKTLTLLIVCFKLVSCLTYSSTKKMKVTLSSKIRIDFEQTIWCYIPEEWTLPNPEFFYFFHNLHELVLTHCLWLTFTILARDWLICQFFYHFPHLFQANVKVQFLNSSYHFPSPHNSSFTSSYHISISS